MHGEPQTGVSLPASCLLLTGVSYISFRCAQQYTQLRHDPEKQSAAKVSSQTENLDFRGFDLKQLLHFKGWNSEVNRELSRKLDSEILCLRILSLRIDRNEGNSQICLYLSVCPVLSAPFQV